MVMQRFAKPCTSVQFRFGPPPIHSRNLPGYVIAFASCNATAQDWWQSLTRASPCACSSLYPPSCCPPCLSRWGSARFVLSTPFPDRPSVSPRWRSAFSHPAISLDFFSDVSSARTLYAVPAIRVLLPSWRARR